MKRLFTLLAALLAFATAPAVAQDERAYSEGAAVVVTAVRVKDGQSDNYMNYLKASYKPLLEEEKKAGIILSYHIYETVPRSPNDPNMYLVVAYPNMASFDGLEDKTEPLARKVLGQNRTEGNKAYADRAAMREILGSELIRELVLK
jgi:hypothetical protein